jgi:hypothetical protein
MQMNKDYSDIHMEAGVCTSWGNIVPLEKF